MSLSIAACKEVFPEILDFHAVNNYAGAAESTERLCHLKVANSSVSGVSVDDAPASIESKWVPALWYTPGRKISSTKPQNAGARVRIGTVLIGGRDRGSPRGSFQALPGRPILEV